MASIELHLLPALQGWLGADVVGDRASELRDLPPRAATVSESVSE